MSDDVLVRVDGVSKKFCRSLKRSLWYGVQDVSSELLGTKGGHDELRQGEFWAVDDVSFELRRGECLGLIGPNGAGKSTLLKMLNGLVKPDRGRISMRGRVGALIELGAGFNPILTARENIYVNGSVLGFTKKEIDRKFDAIVDFAEIEEFIDTPVQNYSSGMKVRLGFAVAAQMEPDVLLIDEVLAVGDEGFRNKCLNVVSQIAESACCVLVSHFMPDVARTVSHISLLGSGKARAYGSDVAQGIHDYHQLFSSTNIVRQETEFARIMEVQIRRDKTCGQELTTFRHGDKLCIEIKVLLNISTDRCGVNINIHDSNRNVVAQITSVKKGFFLCARPYPQDIRVEVPFCPLSLGRYSLSVYFVEYFDSNRRGEIFAFKHDAASFNILDETPGYASVILDANWLAP